MAGLDLSGNQINGTLPESWSGMTKLGALDASFNQISGLLPPSWSSMVQLVKIVLASNFINGNLPSDWLANWSAIALVDLSDNMLTGMLPLTIIKTNATLLLSNNGFEFPRFLLNCATCSSAVVLSGNAMTGTLPQTILGPRGGLVLSDNSLSGPIPSYIDAASLDLSYNNMSGIIPCIGGALQELRLDGNAYIQGLPTPIGGGDGRNCSMPNITRLSMNDCDLDEFPLEMDILLPNLDQLTARGVIANPQPMPTFAAARLRVLDLSKNEFTTPMLSVMANGSLFVDVTPVTTSEQLYQIGGLNLSLVCIAPNCSIPYQSFTRAGVFFSSLGEYADRCYAVEAYATFSGVRNLTLAFSMFLLCELFVENHALGVLQEGYAIYPLTFFPIELQVFYWATLTVLSIVPADAVLPVPTWNNTISQLTSSSSNRLTFAGLLDADLLRYNVTYKITVTFALPQTTLGVRSGTVIRKFSHNISLPPCGESLFAVPFSSSCVSCPSTSLTATSAAVVGAASCDGTSTLQTTIAAWRPENDLLPLYDCESGGSKGCAVGSDGTVCRAGYEGPLCAVCSAGYGLSPFGCSACAPTWVNVILLVLGFVVLIAVFTFAVLLSTTKSEQPTTLIGALKKSGATSVKILSNHFSLMVPMASAARAVLTTSGSSAIDVQATICVLNVAQLNAVPCLIPAFTAAEQLVSAVVALVALIAFEAAVAKWLAHREHDLVAVVACVVQLLYMTLIGNAAGMLQFDSMTFYPLQDVVQHTASGPSVIFSTLKTDRRLNRSDSASIIIFAWCVLGFFGLGAPLAFVVAHKFQSSEDSARNFHFLTANFRPSSWFWEAVVAIRKALGIACFSLASSGYPTAVQLHIYQLVLVLYLFVFEQVQPTSRNLTFAERVSCWGAIVTSTLLLVASATTTVVQQSPVLGGFVAAVQAASLFGVVYCLIAEAQGTVRDAKGGNTAGGAVSPLFVGAVIEHVEHHVPESQTVVEPCTPR